MGWEVFTDTMSQEHAAKLREQLRSETGRDGGEPIVEAALKYLTTEKVQTNKTLPSVKALVSQLKFQELAKAHKVETVALAEAVHRLYGPKGGCVRPHF